MSNLTNRAEKTTDKFGLPRLVATSNAGGRSYSYDGGRTWRTSAKSARAAATGEIDDAHARAVLECRMVVGA